MKHRSGGLRVPLTLCPDHLVQRNGAARVRDELVHPVHGHALVPPLMRRARRDAEVRRHVFQPARLGIKPIGEIHGVTLAHAQFLSSAREPLCEYRFGHV